MIALCSAFTANTSQAQDWDEGHIAVSAGTSFGAYSWRLSSQYSRLSSSLPLYASVEYGAIEDLGVGVYGGIQTQRYRFDNGIFDSEYDYSLLSFGIKATYHFTNLINSELDGGVPSEVDIYASAYAGPTIGTWSRRDAFGAELSNTFSLNFSPVIGIRYMLAKNFGVYAEAGRGALGYFSGGLTLKL